MEFALIIVFLFVALLVGGLVALVSAASRGSEHGRRIASLEQEIVYARQAYDQLSLRIAPLERALAEAQRAAAPAIAPPPAAPEAAPALPPRPEPVHEHQEIPAAPQPEPSPPQPSPPQREPSRAQSEPSPAQPEPSPPQREPSPAQPEPSLPQPEPPQPAIDWERWIGVRGAAALGAGILVIAGLYFFKYSVEQGVISPGVRVLLGAGVGLGCVGASELLQRRRYSALASWLAGGGTAILYTAFWAARALYELIGAWTAFGLMVSVTAGCVLLSIRHAAMAVAILGLLGGFITPFALSSGGDHPIGLFGYLLLLDAALLSLAYRNRWPTLAALSLLGTWVYQVAWIGGRMRPEQLWIGIGAVSVFAALYAFGARPARTDDEELTLSRTQAVAILFPFLFGLYFGLRSDLGDRLYPVALMLAVLSTGACWIARAQRAGWMAMAAAAGSAAVLGASSVGRDTAAGTWDVLFAIALLAVVFHAFLELAAREPEGASGSDVIALSRAAAVNTLGSMLLLIPVSAGSSSADPKPWFAGLLALAALSLRNASLAAGPSGWIAIAAAGASALAAGAWIAGHDPGERPGEIVALVGVLAGVFHAYLERAERWPEPRRRASSVPHAAAVSSLALLLVLLAAGAAPSAASPWPWLGGAVLLSALVLRNAGFEGRAPLHLGVAIGLGLGVPWLHLAHGGDGSFADTTGHVGFAVVAAGALQLVAHLRREGAGAAWSARAAALLPLLCLVDLLAFPLAPAPALHAAATLALGALALVSAARLGSAKWALAAMLAVALVQGAWADAVAPSSAPLALFAIATATALFAAWPLASPRSGEDAWSFRVAALAGAAFFFPLRSAFLNTFGAAAVGAVPLALALLAAGVAERARAALDPASPVRRTALVWLFGAAIAFTSLAVPMQLRDEWITIGWALLGLVLLAVWRRFDHAGLKYVALAHLAIVTLRLVANPGVLDYHPRPTTPIVNWLLHTYALPALCLAAAWRLLRPLEVDRLRPWEQAFQGRRAPLAAMGSALSALVIVFVWLNLSIINVFATGAALELTFEHQPARDLTLSIAWAVYALILLATGMARGSAGLRWVSLALVLVTAGKVFLYDLSHLRDLYRVASLVGLALSLIVISLAYQRFVFGRNAGKRAEAYAGQRPGEAPGSAPEPHVASMDKKQDKEGTNTEKADERTQRRQAEEQGGGMSSQESAERYASGENPGGTHSGGSAEGAKENEDGGKPNNYEDLGLKKDQG